MAKKLDDAAGGLPATPMVFAPVVPVPASTATSDLERAVAFIETSFAQPVSLTMLATLAGLSVSRFATLFRQEVGISPHRYLCLVRVRHAQRLLRHGTPPSVVATEVGFFDQSHLGRHFRRTVGVTPGDYVVRPSA
jgi:transcriptional regulator GlxA family with amidase domain